MAYDLAKISMTALMEPAFRAGIALTRLDERIARSPVGAGFLERIVWCDVPWVQKQQFAYGETDGLFVSDSDTFMLYVKVTTFGEKCAMDVLKFERHKEKRKIGQPI